MFTLISHIILMTFWKNDLEEHFCTRTSHTWPFSCHKSPKTTPIEFPGSSFAVASCDVHILGKTGENWRKLAAFLRFDTKVGNGKKKQSNKIGCFQFKTTLDVCTMSMRMFPKTKLVSDAFLSFMFARLGNNCDESYTICLLISSPWELWNSENIHNFIDNFMMIHPGRLTAGT